MCFFSYAFGVLKQIVEVAACFGGAASAWGNKLALGFRV